MLEHQEVKNFDKLRRFDTIPDRDGRTDTFPQRIPGLFITSRGLKIDQRHGTFQQTLQCHDLPFIVILRQ